MLEFKSTEDLAKLAADDPAFPIVEDLVKRLITDYIAEGCLYAYSHLSLSNGRFCYGDLSRR